MVRQSSSCPLQRVNNINMVFSHNFKVNVDELIAYENAIVDVLQLRKYTSKRGLSHRLESQERISRESDTNVEPEN